MTSPRCASCDQSLVLVRAGSRFCSTRCRMRSYRAGSRPLSIPSEMQETARFVRFTSAKRPITVDGKSASSTNAETWSSFAVATKSRMGEGVGFVLGAGIGCIDLDHCIVDGKVAVWAQEVLDANPGTYVEVSRSGSGLHVFGFRAEGSGRNVRRGDVAVEWYSVGRYIALTGVRHGDAPLCLAPLVVPLL